VTGFERDGVDLRLAVGSICAWPLANLNTGILTTPSLPASQVPCGWAFGKAGECVALASTQLMRVNQLPIRARSETHEQARSCSVCRPSSDHDPSESDLSDRDPSNLIVTPSSDGRRRTFSHSIARTVRSSMRMTATKTTRMTTPCEPLANRQALRVPVADRHHVG
jgi:hypothetical protein